MTVHRSEKEQLIDALLESLEYEKLKEDVAITQHLRAVFRVPAKRKLHDHLLEEVDVSKLFVELLKLTEPFAQMMNEIYTFLAEQRKTARSLEHLIVGENVKDSISFDLESFPQIYQPVIQRIEGYLHRYDLKKVRNSNISPLFLTERLLGCGHCTDTHYQKTSACQKCDIALQARFRNVFRQLEEMIAMLPEDDKHQEPFNYLCEYFDTANKRLRTGTHWNTPCWGYQEWTHKLWEIESRIKQVSKQYKGTYDATVLIRFFELPFWKQRHRLYEVWTLTHFIHLLRGASFELNIKDGQWLLMYSESSEPVVWIHGNHFELEVWYQYQLKAGLKMFQDDPVEPEMLFLSRKQNGTTEPLALIECKERKDYKAREVKKLAAFYRGQVGAALNIFCNYYDYAPPIPLQISQDAPPIVICGKFRPRSSVVADIDREFMGLIKQKLGIFLQAVLVDVSGSMVGRDVEATYQDLHTHLSLLPGSKSRGGIFASQVELCDHNMLINALHNTTHVGSGTQLRQALDKLHEELLRSDPELTIVNYYVITDAEFEREDWVWLEDMDVNGSYTITLVARKEWISDEVKERIKAFKRIKCLFLEKRKKGSSIE